MYNKFFEIYDNCKITIQSTKFKVSYKDTHKKDIAVSNHDIGIREVFTDIYKLKNIYIDFNGSVFNIDGRITPFVLKDCENITLKNFSINYTHRFYLQTEILGYNKNSVILKPSGNEEIVIEDNVLKIVYNNEKLTFNGVFYAQEFENDFKVAKKTSIKIFNSDNVGFVEKDGLLYFSCKDFSSFIVGNFLCFFCEPRTSDAVLIDNCKNVLIENLTIYSSPSMGVMCQLSENIRLEKIKVVKDKLSKYEVTTLADATHFFACRGKIRIRDCVFENMNDDATNIHGIYQVVSSNNLQEIITEIKHIQQQGVNSYKNGDVIAILDGKTKRIKYKAKVVSASMIGQSKCRIIIDKIIDSCIGDIVENISANPDIVIDNCKTGNNRPRGFLVASKKKTVIKNCEFYNSECGVGVFADTDCWFESGSVKNVRIINNKFKCNYGGGTSAIHISPSVNYDYIYFNKKVVIKNNVFDLSFGKAISAKNTEKIIVKDNRYFNYNEETEKSSFCECGQIIGGEIK